MEFSSKIRKEMAAKYLKRYIESQIKRKMRSSGAILVSGPKFCGKTTTSLRFAKSSIRLNTRQAINLARMEPAGTLIGDRPRVIDEWQTAPDIWNQVKSWVDEHPGFGQFILTGSTTPADVTQIYHSGAGRIAKLMMRPMSLSESLESSGTVSLSKLFDNPESRIYDDGHGVKLSDIAFLLCRGGWPLSLQRDSKVALDVTRNYYDGLFNFENSDNERFRNKNPHTLCMVLRSYARNISTEAGRTTMVEDVARADNRTIDPKTFDDYADALTDLFIIDDMEAWNTNLRSKTVIRTSPTRHFVDPSIACASLGITPAALMADLNSFGLFFEDMAVRDLRIYVDYLGGKVQHYRDSRKLECDAVVTLDDGRWALIEVKLGGEDKIEEGAQNMKRLRGDLSGQQPNFCMVLTAVGPSYRREDGVYVASITSLKP